jgi:hypothetical protein
VCCSVRVTVPECHASCLYACVVADRVSVGMGALQFLDAQRIRNLTSYLQALHEQGVANADHTTLLLNCYTKLKDTERLDAFIKVLVGPLYGGGHGRVGASSRGCMESHVGVEAPARDRCTHTDTH